MNKKNKQTFNQRIHVQEKWENENQNNITERGICLLVSVSLRLPSGN